MGFSVVHMMKLSKGAVRGIQSHNQREKTPHSNPDIDASRTRENYDLINRQDINYHRQIRERIEKYAINTKTVRKDAVVLCNFIITSDEKTMKAMSPDMQRDFFNHSLHFFKERYGAENIINATVHLDETTPHLHLGLVPITKDGRLSAKSLFTKIELQNLQTDFSKNVGEHFSLQRGISGSSRTHLSEQQFKTKTALTREQEALQETLKAQDQLENIKYSTNVLKAEYDALNTFLTQSAVESELSTVYPAYARVEEKGLFKKERFVTVPSEMWEKKHVSANQMQAIIQSRENLENSIKELKQYPPMNEIKRLEKQNKLLTKNNKNLQNKLTIAMQDIKQIRSFFDRHTNIAEIFFKERQNPKDNMPIQNL